MRFVLFVSILAATALLIYYIFQVNAEISEKYSIQKNNITAKALSAKNNSLEEDLVAVNSLNNITSQVENLKFEKAENVTYIRVLGNQVGVK